MIKRSLEDNNHCPISCIHTVNHVVVSLSTFFAQCDLSDLGTEHIITNTALDHPFRILVSIHYFYISTLDIRL